jgi:hypothetical protein
MIGYTTRAFILATALVGSAVPAAPSAKPGTKFDGRWSVRVIYPTTGPCSSAKSYQFEAQIINGIIQLGGKGIDKGLKGAFGSASGRLASSGAVNLTVSISVLQYYIVSFGRLSNDSGSGSWRFQGPNEACSGTWSAQRS